MREQDPCSFLRKTKISCLNCSRYLVYTAACWYFRGCTEIIITLQWFCCLRALENRGSTPMTKLLHLKELNPITEIKHIYNYSNWQIQGSPVPTSPYYIYCPKIIPCHLQIATLVLGHHPDHFSSEGINREPWGRIFLTFLTGKKWPLIPTLCFLSFKQLSLSCHCVTSPSLLLCKGTAQVKVQLHCTS